MKKLGYFALLTVLIFIVSCESPMKIQINELDNIIGSDFNRSMLKEGGDFSVGYYNGKLTTSKVELTWSQTTEDNFAFYKLSRNNAELAVFNDISVISFQDTLVNENSYYDYQITVFAENGMVAKDTIEIKTPLWESPSNLIVNGLSTTDVELTWTDNSESEENFKIYFYDSTERSLLDSFIVEANITEKIVTDLNPTAIYSFEVKAVNQWEEDSPLSTTEWFDMNDFVFDAPSNLICNQNFDMSIELNWIDNSTLETGFSIERKINSGNFIEIAEIDDINLETYTDLETYLYNIGDTLIYKVRAYNSYENLEYTDYSNEFSIIISEAPEFVEIGSGTELWDYPFYTYYHDARTQSLYLQSEIQNSGLITKIGYNVFELPGQSMNNCTIRMKHTQLTQFQDSNYDNYGYQNCNIENLIISDYGWIEIEFDNPFYYNGTDNLIIDFSFDNNSYTSNGSSFSTDTFSYRSIVEHADSGMGDPLYWNNGDLNTNIPNIRLYFN
jgi:hypothetical protein